MIVDVYIPVLSVIVESLESLAAMKYGELMYLALPFVVYVYPLDGTERSQVIPGDQTTFDLTDMQEGITYVVRVTAVVGTREGSPVTINVKTGLTPC